MIAAATAFAESSNPQDELFALAFDEEVRTIRDMRHTYTTWPPVSRTQGATMPVDVAVPVRTWITRSLIAVGVGCLGWCAIVVTHAAMYQRDQRMLLDRMLREPAPRSIMPRLATVGPGGLVGAMEIPRLRLSATVIEGDDESALKVAIGHLSETPMPWEEGNSALAAHRDTFFRPLKDVAVGDVIRVTTPHGEFEYRVRETLIVSPEDLWVLDSTARPTLTLITCYPFSYVGHAPQRFIVRAERAGDARKGIGT